MPTSISNVLHLHSNLSLHQPVCSAIWRSGFGFCRYKTIQTKFSTYGWLKCICLRLYTIWSYITDRLDRSFLNAKQSVSQIQKEAHVFHFHWSHPTLLHPPANKCSLVCSPQLPPATHTNKQRRQMKSKGQRVWIPLCSIFCTIAMYILPAHTWKIQTLLRNAAKALRLLSRQTTFFSHKIRKVETERMQVAGLLGLESCLYQTPEGLWETPPRLCLDIISISHWCCKLCRKKRRN